MTIRARLLLVMVGALLTLALTFVIALNYRNTRDQDHANALLISAIHGTMAKLGSLATEHRYLHNQRTRQQFDALMVQAQAQMNDVLLLADPPSRSLADAAAAKLVEIGGRYGQLDRMLDAPPHQEILDTTLRNLQMSVLDTAYTLSRIEARQKDLSDAHEATGRRWLIAVITTLALAFVGFARILHRTVIQPLQTLDGTAQAIANGNLDARSRMSSGSEIGRLARTLDQMAENLARNERARERLVTELERSNGELEQFAYAASHDLQEPLRTIISYLQLIERRHGQDMPGKQRELMHFVVQAAQRMKTLINDLLTYSRLTTRAEPFEPVDLEALLAGICTDLASVITESGARIDVGALPRVQADAGQVRQLFQNLLSNALKFHEAERPPVVSVSSRRTDDGADWAIDVRDNGIGIEPQFHQRIFEVFQRLHTAEDYPGTGIGLAICQKIAERHGGRIDVSSLPGAGSCFSVVLPASRPSAGTAAREDPVVAPTPGEARP
ncbi:MAG: HAMP domain-containing protein [Rhodocyclaceae bacterium]|nr:HAMP domain-containing protein [Rhodocyclaceae bacterium]